MSGTEKNNIDSIADRQRRENARVDGRISKRLAEARRFAAGLPRALRGVDPQIRKIVLFGSVASGDPTRLDFDIDVAVDSDLYVRLVDWALDQSWKIDLVDLERVGNALRQEIGTKGQVLYEANT